MYIVICALNDENKSLSMQMPPHCIHMIVCKRGYIHVVRDLCNTLYS